MNILSIIGAFIITFAFLSYGIGSISVQRFKLVTPGVLIFITIGVVLDIIAVIFMISGSQNTPFSLHGFLGYSAFLTMIIDLFLIWRSYHRNGWDSVISKPLIIYSRIAYSWWVVAYITGSLLVIWK